MLLPLDEIANRKTIFCTLGLGVQTLAETKQFCCTYFDDDDHVEVEEALMGIDAFLNANGSGASIVPELPAGSEYLDLFEDDDSDDDENDGDESTDDSSDDSE